MFEKDLELNNRKEKTPSDKALIAKLRGEIDGLDGEILALLKRRFDITDEIGKIKNGLKEPVFQEEREREILARAAETLGPAAAEKIYGAILEFSKSRQSGNGEDTL